MSHTSGTAADHRDLLDKLDAFLTNTGHAWGKAFTGVGNGDLVDYIGTAASVAETLTITLTSATGFTVSGSTTGALAAGTVGTPYTSAVIAFTIEAGSTPFQAGDVFTIQTSPAWVRSREAGRADTLRSSSNMTNLENLFNNSTSSYAYRVASDCYIEWEMHRPTEINQLLLQIAASENAPGSLTLKYRDNVIDPWTTAQTWVTGAWTQFGASKYFELSTPPGTHKYWRLEFTSSATEIRIAYLMLSEKIGDTYSVANTFQVLWTAPGLDGNQTINIGASVYGNADTGAFNNVFSVWRETDVSASIHLQPNGSGSRPIALSNSPMPYWIIANGQRFIVAVKFSSLYQFAYAGYGNPYETPTIHPFPAIVGGSNGGTSTSTDGDFRYPADPGEGGLTAYYPDGQWREHANRAKGGDSEGAYSTYKGKVWPSELAYETAEQPDLIRENIDGSRPLIPLILWHKDTPAHVWGEFDGVYWTTGFSTVSEAIIREGLYDHLVINNIFRTGVQHYAALRLD